jgi:FemAB-related protein (PEP-CTERM system-associated)
MYAEIKEKSYASNMKLFTYPSEIEVFTSLSYLMTVILQNITQPEWDAYLKANSTAIFSHRYGWGEILAATYRLPIFRLASSRAKNGQITGILPLILFAPPNGEKRLISLPYTDAAGIVAEDAAGYNQLLAAALELATEVGAVHVELRQAGNGAVHEPAQEVTGCWEHTAHTFKTGLLRPLPESSEVLWSLLSAKVRNQVRKARRCDCVAQTGGIELFDAFFAVFSENMRDLGSPVHDPALFQHLLADSAQQAKVVVIFIATLPVAAAIVFKHNSTLHNPWASSLRRWRPSCPNMLLYWTMLEYGIKTGCQWFDFGRSSPTAPTCRFKSQWGGEKQSLVWHVFSRRPAIWNPHAESLENNAWKAMEIEASRRDGPARRRWISL